FILFKESNMHGYPFMKRHGHFHHHTFFRGEGFEDHFEKHGGAHFFTEGRHGGRHGKGRFFKRGDIKIVLLKLLQDQPRHGYDLIKALEEKFKGFYTPSPGSVYPTLQMLEDQDLVEVTQDGRKKVYHLTEEGQTYLEEHEDEDPIIAR